MPFHIPEWFTTIGAIIAVGAAFAAVLNFINTTLRARVEGKRSNTKLLIDTEATYLERITAFRDEVADLKARIVSIETKLALREKEILHLEGQRISAFMRVHELEVENESLRKCLPCSVEDCGLRVIPRQSPLI